jgi:hypothetical protein
MPKPAVWAAWENWAGAVATQLGPRWGESGPSACSFFVFFSISVLLFLFKFKNFKLISDL